MEAKLINRILINTRFRACPYQICYYEKSKNKTVDVFKGFEKVMR